jgi:hemerythrin superfamily protein
LKIHLGIGKHIDQRLSRLPILFVHDSRTSSVLVHLFCKLPYEDFLVFLISSFSAPIPAREKAIMGRSFMLATEILSQDHRDVLAMIDHLNGARNDDRGNKEIFDRLAAALEIHMQAEEEIYYPALAEHEEFEDLLEENVPEHEMVRENLAQMSQLAVSSDTFQSVLEEMRVAILAHVTNEEENIFPESISVLGDEAINDLGNRIDQLKGDAGLSQGASM